MVQTTANTVSATNVFSASAAVDTQIPRSGFIPHIALNLEARYDNSGGPTFYSDVFDRLITSLVIAGDGRQFVNISDMRLLAALNYLDYGLNARRSDVITTTTNNLRNDVPYHLHFGQNPNDPWDPMGSAGSPIIGIPASQMNTLTMTATWGATTAMAAATGVVDTASALRVLPHVITPNFGVGGERWYPKLSTTVYTIAATWTNFGLTFDVPVGGIVRRALVMVVDNTSPSIRDDTRVSRVGLISPKDGNAHRWEGTWAEFKQFTAMQYPRAVNPDTSLVSINQLTGLMGTGSLTNIANSYLYGIGCFDFRKMAVMQGTDRINPLGADMRGLSQGDLKIGLDVATGNGQILILWDEIQPYL